MEITYKKGAPTVRLLKHNKKGNFPRIVYRIAKNLRRRGHGTDLVQLTKCKIDYMNISLKTIYCTVSSLDFKNATVQSMQFLKIQ